MEPFLANRQFPAKKSSSIYDTLQLGAGKKSRHACNKSTTNLLRVCTPFVVVFVWGKGDSSFSSKSSLLFPRRKCALLQETKTWNLAKLFSENLLFGLNHVFAAERVSPSFSPAKRNTIINPFPLSPFPHSIQPAVWNSPFFKEKK